MDPKTSKAAFAKAHGREVGDTSSSKSLDDNFIKVFALLPDNSSSTTKYYQISSDIHEHHIHHWKILKIHQAWWTWITWRFQQRTSRKNAQRRVAEIRRLNGKLHAKETVGHPGCRLAVPCHGQSTNITIYASFANKKQKQKTETIKKLYTVNVY